MTNPAFDAVVIGSGMFGAYCADKLFRDTKLKRTLLLEAGAFLVAEHFQDLPNIGLNVPDPMDPGNDNGPAEGNCLEDAVARKYSFVGTPYCVGGKSVYWGGWCPRLTDARPSCLATDRSPIFEEQLSSGRRAAWSVGPHRFHSRVALSGIARQSSSGAALEFRDSPPLNHRRSRCWGAVPLPGCSLSINTAVCRY